ncbi:hypothetical protein [Pseudonocardia zijingensis]|uniref:Uncharacterized protein n=1 Tax=Pseudonocardia zijingensis TaxID=153376 RepID=A0ABN1N8N0_9PSEU
MAADGLGLAVADIARTILDGIIDHFDAVNAACAAADRVALPRRRVIAPGNPRLIAWDCEQLVVTMSGIGIGTAPGEGGLPASRGNPISATGMRHAVFAVQIVRCVPESSDGTSPPPDDVLTNAGLVFMREAGLLSQALVNICTKVKDGLPGGSRVTPGAVETLGPEGAFAANEGSLAVTVGQLV